MVNEGMFTSKKQDWRTPKEVFDFLNRRFNFTLDACADSNNALCKNYYSKEDSCLSHGWSGAVFMNPPYGREIIRFTRKAILEHISGCKKIVCLLPARTDTKWFYEIAAHAEEIVFLSGRLRFSEGGSAPFPSVIVILGDRERIIQFESLEKLKLYY